MNTSSIKQILGYSLAYFFAMLLICFMGTPLFGTILQVIAGYAFTIVLARSKIRELPALSLGTLFGLAFTGAIVNTLFWVTFIGGRYEREGLAIFMGESILFWTPYLLSLTKIALQKRDSEGERFVLSLSFFLAMVAGGIWLDRHRNTETIDLDLDSRNLPEHREVFEENWKKAHPSAKNVSFGYYVTYGKVRGCWVNYY